MQSAVEVEEGKADEVKLAILIVVLSFALQAHASTPCGSYPHCVKLSWQWTAPNADAWVFRVYRSQTDGGPYTKIAGGMTVTHWRDVNVVAGETYYYVVTAYDKTTKEETSYSEQVAATIPTP